MPEALNEHLGHDGAACPDSYYVRTGPETFISTAHSQGAWRPGEQHLAPAAGLVLAEIERRLPSDKLVSRINFDILGVIHSGEFTIDVNVIRPGRTIELIEASMRHGERTSVHARVRRLPPSDTTSVVGDEWQALPEPKKLLPYRSPAAGAEASSPRWTVASSPTSAPDSLVPGFGPLSPRRR